MSLERRNLVDELNRSMPAAKHAELGTRFNALQEAYNDLAAKFDALTAKLDADSGVNGTDYASEIGAAETVQTLAQASA